MVALGLLERMSMLMNQNQITIAEATAGQLTAFLKIRRWSTRKKKGVSKPRSRKSTESGKTYMATRLTAEETKLAGELDANRRKYGREGMIPAIAALRAHDFQQAGEILQGPLSQTYPAVRKSMEAINQLQLDVAKGEFRSAQTRYALVRNISVAVVVCGVLLAAFIGVWLIRAISRPLNEAVRLAKSVAAGDLTQQIDVHSQNETGQLIAGEKNMNASLADTRAPGAHRDRDHIGCLARDSDGNADSPRAPNRRPAHWKRLPVRWKS